MSTRGVARLTRLTAQLASAGNVLRSQRTTAPTALLSTVTATKGASTP